MDEYWLMVIENVVVPPYPNLQFIKAAVKVSAWMNN